MSNFRDVLSHCNLFNLGFEGVPWTFNNKQDRKRNVRVLLDQTMAGPKWSAMFPLYKVSHIVSQRSDHCPLLIQISGHDCKRIMSKKN